MIIVVIQEAGRTSWPPLRTLCRASFKYYLAVTEVQCSRRHDSLLQNPCSVIKCRIGDFRPFFESSMIAISLVLDKC
jgi:hypothetical protein